jgi:preprotein translocase subunit SecF
MQFFKNINWNFLKLKYIALTFSGILIIASFVSLIGHGGPRYGIDFTGGRVIEINFGKKPDLGEVRSVLQSAGFGQLETQSIKNNPWVIFKVPMELDEQYSDISTNIINLLRANFSPQRGYEIEILSIDKVGPKVGSELREKAIKAILLSLALMFIYIWIRFQLRFGAASVIALFHDAFITLGILSLLNVEINLPIIAALLTIVGYSINDSIVISDRIRENMTRLRKLPFHEIVNKSLNQVFSRTIITSLTTLIVVLCLLIFGSLVIRDFALALLIGILIGTYSSIYIVSPIVVMWEKWLPKRVGSVKVRTVRSR